MVIGDMKNMVQVPVPSASKLPQVPSTSAKYNCQVQVPVPSTIAKCQSASAKCQVPVPPGPSANTLPQNSGAQSLDPRPQHQFN